MRKKCVVAGYDPAFGARPLKRVINSELLNPLSVALLNVKFVYSNELSKDKVFNSTYLCS